MDLLAAWLLFPLLAVAVSAGHGLLVERLAGFRLPLALLPAVGLAGVVAVSQLTTYADVTAELTVPLVSLVAVAGWVVGHRRRPGREDAVALVVAGAVFLAFGAPVIFSGEATFAGYTILGDTSIHMIGAAALLEHGRDFGALPPSSYEYSLEAYYGSNGYPSGAPTAVGALTRIAFQDVAWTFQPFLALLAAAMSTALYQLAAQVVKPIGWRALAAFLAAQPALVYAYALQGSVKEVGTAYAVTTIAALIAPTVAARDRGIGVALPLAVAYAAAIGIVGLAAGVWLAPLGLVVLVAALGARPRPALGRLAGASAVFLVAVAVLSYQALVDAGSYVEVAGGVVTTQAEMGNLLAPLDPAQMLGIWLAGDYRLAPAANLGETRWLLGIAVAAGAIGLAAIARRRAWAVAAYLGVSLLAWWYVTRTGSPWADGKAHTIVSPALVLTAVLGAALLWELRPRAVRLAAVPVAAAVALGVLWSNALAYHDVSLAPRDRLAELGSIGERIAGQGPTLYTEFEEWGKHFLRDAAPEGSTEGWQRRYGEATGRNGVGVRFGFATDPDFFTDRYLLGWRTLVLRKGFAHSRPPSPFERTIDGRWYEVWERAPDAGDTVIEHLSLGTDRAPAAAPACPDVRRLAGRARAAGGDLVVVERPPAAVSVPATLPRPAAWFVDPTDAAVVRPQGAGEVEIPFDVPSAGRYGVWIEGSFGRGVAVAVGGRRIGEVRDRINGRLTAERVATVELDAGRHVVTLRRGGGSLAPGNGGLNRLLGPVALVPEAAARVERVAPDRWRTLCRDGRQFDWIEAVRPA